LPAAQPVPWTKLERPLLRPLRANVKKCEVGDTWWEITATWSLDESIRR
jgi:hypothetical protein